MSKINFVNFGIEVDNIYIEMDWNVPHRKLVRRVPNFVFVVDYDSRMIINSTKGPNLDISVHFKRK